MKKKSSSINHLCSQHRSQKINILYIAGYYKQYKRKTTQILSTGSPRPFGPGLTDGPSGFSHSHNMMYSPGGGTDFYRVNQTGKDDLIVVYLLLLIRLFLQKKKYIFKMCKRMLFFNYD